MRTPVGYAVVLMRCLLFLSIVALVLSIGGFVTSQVRNVPSIPTFNSDSVSGYRAYGEVPIPGTQTLHLPAGPVAITFHAETVGIPEAGLPVPDLKLDINPPAGVADPQVAEKIGGTTSFNNDAWRQVWVAQIPQEGDYQIATDGQVTAFVSAQLAFGKVNFSPPSAPSASGPLNPSGGLASLSRIAFIAALLTLIGCVWGLRMLAGRANQVESAADLLGSGERVPCVLNAFRDTGRTARSLGNAPTRPEFLDDPLFALDVELQLPDRTPLRGRSVQRVPRAQAASLAVGRQLMCVVDPAKPSRRFVVDWGDVPPPSADSAALEGISIEAAPAAAAPTAIVPQAQSIAARLQELETLRAAGAISDAEYTAKRQQIIADI
ncbi:MAG TPA: SHOCT domain-containing protein [Mycobacterium sp.]|nr:SHOCT domain-containing protein [Mycobacterium sp.]